MRRLAALALVAALPASGVSGQAPQATASAPAGLVRVRHALQVSLDPERGFLSVKDTLRVPAAAAVSGELQFLLHASLKLVASEPAAVEIPADAAGATRFFGINSGSIDLYAEGQLKRYRVALPATGASVSLAYEGRFDFGL